MGWTYTHRSRGMSDLDFFTSGIRRKVTGPDGKESPSSEHILAAATVGMRACYIAYRTHQGNVICVVCLIHWVPNARDGFNFGYKDMEEGDGPCESDCPERIMKLLDPVENSYSPDTSTYNWASAWRQRCWDNINHRKAKPSIKAGQWVIFTEPVRFMNGHTRSALQVEYIRGSRVALTDGAWDYRMSRSRLTELIDHVCATEEEYKQSLKKIAAGAE